MARKLEKLTGNEGDNNEIAEQIYIGRINKRDFSQSIIGNRINEIIYLDEYAKNFKKEFGISIEGKELEIIGHGIAFEIYNNDIKNYEIKNGYYIDKKTREIIQVEKLPIERKIDLIAGVRISLIISYGEENKK